MRVHRTRRPARPARHVRLAVAGVAVTTLLLGACADRGDPKPATGSGGQGLTKVKVIVPVAGTISLAYAVAEERGIFRQNGLEIELSATHGGGPDIAALTSGGVDFDIVAGGGVIGAVENGSPLISTYVVTDKPVGILVMRKEVAAKRGITSDAPLERRVAALNGAKVGVSTPGGFAAFMLDYYVRKFDLKGVQPVPLGAADTATAGFQRGLVDALLYFEPVPEQLIRSNGAVQLLNPGLGDAPDLVPFYMETLATRRDFAKQRPEVVRALVRSLEQAVAWTVEHEPAEIAEVIRPLYPSIDPALLPGSIAQLKGLLSRTGCASRQAVERAVQFFIDGGYLKRRTPWTQVASNEFLSRPCPEVGAKVLG